MMEFDASRPLSRSLLVQYTDWHRCSYLSGRAARTQFVQDLYNDNKRIYQALQERGYRRSGSALYRPDCGPCRDCIPARLPVQRFALRRRHRRLLGVGDELFTVRWDRAQFTREYFDLYQRYLNMRHSDGDMANPHEEDFARFLIGGWSPTRFLRIEHQQHLVAVAVTDLTEGAVSAIYTFFDPDYQSFSPGGYALLSQIREARQMGLGWLYLGFWVPGCRKMSYKASYRPIQLLLGGKWREFGYADSLPPLAPETE